MKRTKKFSGLASIFPIRISTGSAALGLLSAAMVHPVPLRAQVHNTVFSYSFPGGNLVRNGSFENNPSMKEWDGWYKGLTQEAAAFPPMGVADAIAPYEGRQYLGAKFSCQATGEGTWKVVSDGFPVKAGKTYTLFLRYQSDIVTNGTTPNVVRPGVRFWSLMAHEYDPETGAFVSLPAPVGQSHEVTPAVVGTAGYVAQSSWTTYSLQFTVPAGSVFARVFLLKADAVGNGGTFQFDDVYLVEGAVALTAVGNPLHPANIGKALTYSDARSKVMQTVVPDGERDIVTQTLYDGLGRRDKKFLPIADDFGQNPERPGYFGSHRHEFVPDITGQGDASDRMSNFYTAKPVDAVNGPRTYQVNLDDARLPGESAQDPFPQYPDAGGVPFSQVRYEASPLGRVLESGSSGLIWKLGGASVRNNYLSVSTIPDNGQLAPLTGEEGEYFIVQTDGQHEQSAREFRDKLGRVVRKSVAKTTGVTRSWVNTDYEYDAAGNLIKVLSPSDAGGNRLSTNQTYDDLGQLASAHSAATGTTRFYYDDMGRLRFTRTAEQDGGPIRPIAQKPFSFVKYDAMGRISFTGEILDGTLFGQTTALLQEFPCTVNCTNPAAQVPAAKVKFRTLNSYDREGQTLSCAEGVGPGSGSGMSSPAIGDIAFVAESPTGEAVACSYDLYETYANALSKLHGGSGEVRLLAIYDPQGSQVVEPDPGQEFPFQIGNLTFTFEGVSLETQEGEDGKALFDQCRARKVAERGFFRGRLVKTLTCNYELSLALGDPSPREVSKSFLYDAFGNVIQTLEINRYIGNASKASVDTRFVYDRRNRLVQKKVCSDPTCNDEGSHVENNSYDHLSRLEKVTDRNGVAIVHNHYDKLGQLSARALGGDIAPSTGNAILEKVSHHLHGQIKSSTVAQIRDNAKLFGEVLRYEDAINPRLDGTLSEAEYSYPAGSALPNLAYKYTYDLLTRLKTASTVPTSANASSSFDYLDDSRLTSQTRSGATGTYSYDAAGRLDQVTGSLNPERPMQKSDPEDVIFRYDANGNLIEDESRDQDGQPLEIYYRADNLPYMMIFKERTGATGPYVEKTLYMAFGASGNRVSKIEFSDGQRTAVKSYFESGKEVRESKAQATWLTSEYFDLAQRGRVQYSTSFPQGRREFFITDHLGSVRTVYDLADGTTPFTSHYFPYGEELAKEQSNDDVTPGFTGKESDEGIRLNYFGARFYDPDLGLWVSPDPAAQFHSPYAYAANPLNAVDPNGARAVEQKIGEVKLFNDWYDYLNPLAYLQGLLGGFKADVVMIKDDGVGPIEIDNSAEPFYFGNGVGNTPEQSRSTALSLGKQMHRPGYHVTNETRGYVIADLFEAGLLKLGVDNPTSNGVRQLALTKDISTWIVHSEGGVILSEGFKGTGTAIWGTRVLTFGAASFTYPLGPDYHHYASPSDPVAILFGRGLVAGTIPAAAGIHPFEGYRKAVTID